jgi:hypothetical protein
VQCLGIDLLPIGVHPASKVVDTDLMLFDVFQQGGFDPLSFSRCHGMISSLAAQHRHTGAVRS